ncbi:MAG: hypothetical protein ACOC1K_05015 [Nanoarchaeota archaeon]
MILKEIQTQKIKVDEKEYKTLWIFIDIMGRTIVQIYAEKKPEHIEKYFRDEK